VNQNGRHFIFGCFFVSGFCSLVYQVVWTRLAFASFGIITPVISVVLSVFMLGLSVGAWAGGKFIAGWVDKTKLSAIVFYGAAELLIGLGAFAVPKLFAWSEHWLLGAGQTDSLAYLSLSALGLAVSILPWCLCMGATFPLMMAFIRERDRQHADSFSFLYLANVLGAMTGTLLTAVLLVELLGFRNTLAVAAAGNIAVALSCGWLGRKRINPAAVSTSHAAPDKSSPPLPQPVSRPLVKWILFSTGFVAMAMEVVWTRAFTPVLKTQVYSFALVIFTYLGATFVGSWWYRRERRRHSLRSLGNLLAILCVAAFLPIIANDHRFVELNWDWHGNPGSVLLLLASICPFCAGLGYLTPQLVDEYAGGAPERGGQAYAINVLGCILGPLVAGYVLLPLLSERHALILLCLPVVLFLFYWRKELSFAGRISSGLAVGGVLAGSMFGTVSYDDYVMATRENATVRRDYAGSVVSCGTGQGKQLFLNGIGTTTLTPITKFMVHLPLAFHARPPEAALIICFGMGTSHRAALSWGIETTSVELVPSVKEAFGFYHADAAAVLANPKGRIVIDDGRRYLKRSREQFDVIVVDPPPPPEAAGSSLLYSDEFYALVKERLKPDGILQAWLPGGGDAPSVLATLRSVRDAFPQVRCFGSVEGWGVHILCSQKPIPQRSADELVARMPAAARNDLMEWNPTTDATAYLHQLLSHEMAIENDLHPNLKLRISDDRPYNEYFLLRRWKWLSP
jgi:spermidine synthase